MTDADAEVLRAEVVALQAVLISVFRRIATDRPEFTPLFCKAFDEADTILGGVSEKLGLEAPIETTVGAMRIVDELRSAVLRDRSVCSGS